MISLYLSNVAFKVTKAINEVCPYSSTTVKMIDFYDTEPLDGLPLLICEMNSGENNFWNLYFIKSTIKNTDYQSFNIYIAMTDTNYVVCITASGSTEKVDVVLPPYFVACVKGTDKTIIQRAMKNMEDGIMSVLSKII